MNAYLHATREGKGMDSAKQFSCLVLHFEADTIRRLSLRDVNLSEPPEGIRWLHFAGDVERSREWLQNNSPLDSTHVEALCSGLTRPRLYVDSEKNLMLTLRTARTAEGLPLEYMSLRIWASSRQIITVSLKPTELIADFVTRLHVQRKSVVSTEQLLLDLSQYITGEFTRHIDSLDEEIGELEDSWDERRAVDIAELAGLRQKVSRISRYLPPQLEALLDTERLVNGLELPKAMKKRYQDGWREVTNRVRRDIEALAEMRERVAILGDTLQQVHNERINRTMYRLSIVASFFLPLTFVAGLLGMNVAGIPNSGDPLAFWAVCGLMAGIAVFQWLVFKRWRWLR